MPELTIIIPTRETPREFWSKDNPTLITLDQQTYKDFVVNIVPDEGKGANYARNKGFEGVETEFVLFSDDDIEWKSRALETMMRVLKNTPKASYVYGRYLKGNAVLCHHAWDPDYLILRDNYISTMSIIRTEALRDLQPPNTPFDENIKRFQDWDLWMNLWINHHRRGVYCNDLIFETKKRLGISVNSSIDQDMEAREILRKKYGIKVSWRQDLIAA